MTVRTDPKLQILIPGATTGPVVLSPSFADFTKLLETDAQKRSTKPLNYFGDPETRKLHNEVVAHIRDRKKRINQNDVLVAVHPFYLQICKWHQVSEEMGLQIQEYDRKLLDLLKNRPRDLGVILFDTLHHYASASHLLMEQGLVDRVEITGYNNGFTIGLLEFKNLNGRNKFFVGGEAFLDDVIRTFSACDGVSRNFAIPELCYCSPSEQQLTWPAGLEMPNIPIENMLTIDAFKKRLLYK